MTAEHRCGFPFDVDDFTYYCNFAVGHTGQHGVVDLLASEPNGMFVGGPDFEQARRKREAEDARRASKQLVMTPSEIAEFVADCRKLIKHSRTFYEVRDALSKAIWLIESTTPETNDVAKLNRGLCEQEGHVFPRIPVKECLRCHSQFFLSETGIPVSEQNQPVSASEKANEPPHNTLEPRLATSCDKNACCLLDRGHEGPCDDWTAQKTSDDRCEHGVPRRFCTAAYHTSGDVELPDLSSSPRPAAQSLSNNEEPQRPIKL